MTHFNGLVDVDLPTLLLHDTAVEHNLQLMARFCAENGVELAPHAKTHMSEDLCRRQINSGAWGMTAATPAQVRVLAGFGIERILHANLLVDRAAIAWVAETFLSDHAETLPSGVPEYYCYVDSAAGLALLERELARWAPSRKLRVLLELGFAGGRSGMRSDAEARSLAHAVAESALVELAGVAGFEGLMPLANGRVPAEAPQFLARMRALTQYCADTGLFAGTPIITAGGSSFFDLVVDELGPANWALPVTCILRSGCYITHDHGLYARTSPFGQRQHSEGDEGDAAAAAGERFVPALELLASVLSRPEPDRVIVGFGRREAPTDAGLPVVLGRLRSSDLGGDRSDDGDRGSKGAGDRGTQRRAEEFGNGESVAGWEVTGVNDHHAFVRVPADAVVTPGDVLRLGISHPCGAFDRWRGIHLIDDDRQVIGMVRPVL
jgi:D-serine dehydratase